jgi:hypothetical protein
MSRAEGRRWKRELEKRIRVEHRAEAKRALLELRFAIRHAKAERRDALKGAKAKCRTDRVEVRARVRELRARARAELRAAVLLERRQAKETCATARTWARSLGTKVERARAALEAERAYRREMRRIELGNKARRKEEKRSTAKERRGESDDEVAGNLPPEYLDLWERVKRSIHGGPRMSRTEAFLKYAEEHPGELLEGIEARTDAMIRELEQRERAAARELRRGPKKAHVRERVRAAAGEVPF